MSQQNIKRPHHSQTSKGYSCIGNCGNDVTNHHWNDMKKQWFNWKLSLKNLYWTYIWFQSDFFVEYWKFWLVYLHTQPQSLSPRSYLYPKPDDRRLSIWPIHLKWCKKRIPSRESSTVHICYRLDLFQCHQWIHHISWVLAVCALSTNRSCSTSIWYHRRKSCWTSFQRRSLYFVPTVEC